MPAIQIENLIVIPLFDRRCRCGNKAETARQIALSSKNGAVNLCCKCASGWDRGITSALHYVER